MDDDAFATLEELESGLEWELDEGERRLAVQALAEASDLIRLYGRSWTREDAPGFVRRLTLKVTARFMRNPDNFLTSRAGDETLGWQETGAEHAGVYLTKEEQRLVRRFTNQGGLYSVPIRSHGTVERLEDGYVPVRGSKPFPFGPTGPGGEPPVEGSGGAGWPTDAIPTRPL